MLLSFPFPFKIEGHVRRALSHSPDFRGAHIRRGVGRSTGRGCSAKATAGATARGNQTLQVSHRCDRPVGERWGSGREQARGAHVRGTDDDLIESKTPARSGPIRQAELLNDQAWVELLRSFRIADAVVRKLSLYLKPEKGSDRPVFDGFTLADRFLPGNFEIVVDRSRKRWTLTNVESSFSDAGAMGDSVGRAAGFRWVLPETTFTGSGERKIAFTVSTPRESAVQLIGRLNANLAQNSNFLWIRLQDPDAKLAERTLNTWVDEYVRVAGELKKKNVVEYANLLAEQVQFAEKSLKDAESNLENFRIHNDHASRGGRRARAWRFGYFWYGDGRVLRAALRIRQPAA